MKKLFLFAILLTFLASSCDKKEVKTDDSKKVWAWMAGKVKFTDDEWEYYFQHAAQAGIDAVILEVHPGIPDTAYLRSDFVDAEALEILKRALPIAQKHNVEVHAWMWTENRGERTLREAHPEWYMVNKNGESCNINKLYGREHYRFLCPNQPGVVEYLKERAVELAKVDGVAGVHMDFIRYPDAMLPNKLQASRGVVQDKVYPEWDHCYCDQCRELFKAQTGIDPMELEDPSSNQDWLKFRYDGIVNVASEVAKAIQEVGKTSSAAVFPHPDTARMLVRQDWPRFVNLDYIFPMVYHRYYVDSDEWITEAVSAGNAELRANGNPAKQCAGLFIGHVPADSISIMIDYAVKGGSHGICFFSLQGIKREEDKGVPYWEKLEEAIKQFKAR